MSTTMRGRKMTTRMPELATFHLERDYRLDVRRSSNEFIERTLTDPSVSFLKNLRKKFFEKIVDK